MIVLSICEELVSTARGEGGDTIEFDTGETCVAWHVHWYVRWEMISLLACMCVSFCKYRPVPEKALRP